MMETIYPTFEIETNADCSKVTITDTTEYTTEQITVNTTDQFLSLTADFVSATEVDTFNLNYYPTGDSLVTFNTGITANESITNFIAAIEAAYGIYAPKPVICQNNGDDTITVFINTNKFNIAKPLLEPISCLTSTFQFVPDNIPVVVPTISEQPLCITPITSRNISVVNYCSKENLDLGAVCQNEYIELAPIDNTLPVFQEFDQVGIVLNSCEMNYIIKEEDIEIGDEKPAILTFDVNSSIIVSALFDIAITSLQTVTYNTGVNSNIAAAGIAQAYNNFYAASSLKDYINVTSNGTTVTISLYLSKFPAIANGITPTITTTANPNIIILNNSGWAGGIPSQTDTNYYTIRNVIDKLAKLLVASSCGINVEIEYTCNQIILISYYCGEPFFLSVNKTASNLTLIQGVNASNVSNMDVPVLQDSNSNVLEFDYPNDGVFSVRLSVVKDGVSYVGTKIEGLLCQTDCIYNRLVVQESQDCCENACMPQSNKVLVTKLAIDRNICEQDYDKACSLIDSMKNKYKNVGCFNI